MFFIYKLFHPLSNRIYIGKTYNINYRFQRHLSDVRKSKRTDWIKSLKTRYNDIPKMEIIHNNIINEDLANAYEISWIEYYRNNYGLENILNMTDGGDGAMGYKFPADSPNNSSVNSIGKSKGNKSKSGQMACNRKLHPSNIITIRTAHANGISCRKISKIFNVNKSTIQDVVNRKTYMEIQ